MEAINHKSEIGYKIFLFLLTVLFVLSIAHVEKVNAQICSLSTVKYDSGCTSNKCSNCNGKGYTSAAGKTGYNVGGVMVYKATILTGCDKCCGTVGKGTYTYYANGTNTLHSAAFGTHLAAENYIKTLGNVFYSGISVTGSTYIVDYCREAGVTDNGYVKGSGYGAHNWATKATGKTATCMENGCWHYQCSNCSKYSATEHETAIDSDNHSWSDYIENDAHTERHKECNNGCGTTGSYQYYITVKATNCSCPTASDWQDKEATITYVFTPNTGYTF